MGQAKEPEVLTYERLKAAVSGTVQAIRRTMKLEPAGGPGDKVFPSTYEGGAYAFESRLIDGESVETVLLDSVQSQANRIELALLEAVNRKEISDFPLLTVDFTDEFSDIGKITTLEAPHRIADAIFRDSLIDGKPFREHEQYGKRLDNASVKNATPLLDLCPTALIFGIWDSTSLKGGRGCKFARALVSEIVGFNCVTGIKTSSRIDPLQIEKQGIEILERQGGGWTLTEEDAVMVKDKPKKYGDGTPAEINHGNITPTFKDRSGEPIIGGVTISHALQTSVLSLPALRRLRFPDGSGKSNREIEIAARAFLAALSLTGVVLQAEEGYDLRSRCQLIPDSPSVFEFVSGYGRESESFSLNAQAAITLYNEAWEELSKLKTGWPRELPVLTPNSNLVKLVRKSRGLDLDPEE